MTACISRSRLVQGDDDLCTLLYDAPSVKSIGRQLKFLEDQEKTWMPTWSLDGAKVTEMLNKAKQQAKDRVAKYKMALTELKGMQAMYLKLCQYDGTVSTFLLGCVNCVPLAS